MSSLLRVFFRHAPNEKPENPESKTTKKKFTLTFSKHFERTSACFLVICGRNPIKIVQLYLFKWTSLAWVEFMTRTSLGWPLKRFSPSNLGRCYGCQGEGCQMSRREGTGRQRKILLAARRLVTVKLQAPTEMNQHPIFHAIWWDCPRQRGGYRTFRTYKTSKQGLAGPENKSSIPAFPSLPTMNLGRT